MSEHNHVHAHDHGNVFHSHAPAGRMRLAFLLTLIILVVEVLGGWVSHSLALLSDAGHVLTDIGAIGLSWYAMKQSEKPASEGMTFGYYRAGILAAFVNGITLILITIWILWEAYSRFQHPEHVTPTWMFVSAGVGLAMNLYLGLGMRHEENINVRSAVLHMLGDAAASAGVIVGGIIILFTHWYVIDPVLSVLIALLIARGAWKIVKQTVSVLMEGTPSGVEIPKVVNAITSVQGIQHVHDLHVWTITSGRNALSCHVVVDGKMTVEDTQKLLRDAEHKLVHLGIGHVTIQTEDPTHLHDESILCKNDGIEDHHH
ncbi:cation diffusion facilitator family transporter [Alicyclobacillus tolerans]|uniref:Cobalt-zinc-cadmium efflux system protein n=1 Tax=Alicyclobacillus tolerans TaxID=90970 RepID=A0A1M6LTK7_9BACL|nr:cation diffusion facilitator family transporter [Alicyclobacillus montanus]SHJ74412.1 cobalt-zinc-cadmium efflux system protein [Alicyclobacillus montanus]